MHQTSYLPIICLFLSSIPLPTIYLLSIFYLSIICLYYLGLSSVSVNHLYYLFQLIYCLCHLHLLLSIIYFSLNGLSPLAPISVCHLSLPSIYHLYLHHLSGSYLLLIFIHHVYLYHLPLLISLTSTCLLTSCLSICYLSTSNFDGHKPGEKQYLLFYIILRHKFFHYSLLHYIGNKHFCGLLR